MSSSDRVFAGVAAPLLRTAFAAGLMLALGVAAGCTARPLYGDVAPGSAAGVHSAQLVSVDIPPVSDRVGQEVRNHLIFMFGGGQGQPASPVWRLQLATRAVESVPATINTGRVSLEPTSGIMTVTANYRLVEVATGTTVSTGTRSVQAPYDIPEQGFAAARAVRDAENRAARELAELLRLVVAQDLAR